MNAPYSGTMQDDLVRLSDEVLAAYGIPLERAVVPRDEAEKRTTAFYKFRMAQEQDVSQEGD